VEPFILAKQQVEPIYSGPKPDNPLCLDNDLQATHFDQINVHDIVSVTAAEVSVNSRSETSLKCQPTLCLDLQVACLDEVHDELTANSGSPMEVLHSSSDSFSFEESQVFLRAPPSSRAEGGAISKISDWSRSARIKRKLEQASTDPAQTQLTDYYKVLNSIEKLSQQNEKLSFLLQQFQIEGGTHQGTGLTSNHLSLTPVLKQILLNAESNSKKYSTQRTHPEILKKFATSLFIYAGPLAYEFIQQNMAEALPSLRTVQTAIRMEYKTLKEGSFRFDDLVQHIKQHKVQHCYHIGEDATRVIARVDYDSEVNHLCWICFTRR
jgi:hypothetical protein